MLLDSVINYAIDGIRTTFKVDGLILKAKTVEENKLKFKFERMGMKIQIEIPNSDLASIVYYNFLDEEVREDIMEFEFVDRFKEYLQVCNPLEAGDVEKFVKKMCDDIRSSKLFKGNGQVMKQQEEQPQEPLQVGYDSQEEKEQQEKELINDDIPEAEIVEDEPEEFLEEEEEQEIF